MTFTEKTIEELHTTLDWLGLSVIGWEDFDSVIRNRFAKQKEEILKAVDDKLSKYLGEKIEYDSLLIKAHRDTREAIENL